MSYMIKDMPVEEKPREKAKKHGLESLSDTELIAILLRTGTKDKSVKELAMDIVSYIKSLPSIFDLRLSNLASFKGIGEVKAITIMSAIELGRRMNIKDNKERIIIKSASDVYLNYNYEYRNETQEKLMVLYLDSKNEVIENKIIFIGTNNESICHPRDIYKEAIILNSSKIICIHNHPSGNPKPSAHDKIATKNIKKTGEIIGIPLIDHIIIGKDNYSFRKMMHCNIII